MSEEKEEYSIAIEQLNEELKRTVSDGKELAQEYFKYTEQTEDPLLDPTSNETNPYLNIKSSAPEQTKKCWCF